MCYHLQRNITVKETYNAISDSIPRCRLICPLNLTFNNPHIFSCTLLSFVLSLLLQLNLTKLQYVNSYESKNFLTKTCIFLWEIIIYSRKNVDFRASRPTENDILGMIDDKCLKTRVIPIKLSSFERIRWTLQADHKNMCDSLRNYDLFSKKRRFSCLPANGTRCFGYDWWQLFEILCYSMKSSLNRQHSLNSTSRQQKLLSSFEK